MTNSTAFTQLRTPRFPACRITRKFWLRYRVAQTVLATQSLRTYAPFMGKWKHGWSGSRTHRAWMNMKRRCYCPTSTRFEQWGGRGIAVCPRWRNDFSAFLEDMGECPSARSLDRIDNDRDYEPSNCRWATAEEQTTNRSNTVWLEYGGERLNLTQWARKLGTDKRTLWYRVHAKWPVERILTEPIGEYNGQVIL